MWEQLITEREIHILINLALCIVAGLMIGIEREWRGKAAGIGTHILVIVGSMLFTYMSVIVDQGSPSRIAAQVVSGIGFLGAGLILKEGANVKNLTTAASLWVAAAIGMAFGFNFRAIGMIVAVAISLIPRIPHVKVNGN